MTRTEVEMHGAPPGVPRHPVVAIGDGLGQAVRSGAVSSDFFSYVDLVAEAMGVARPRAPRFDGNGGIPLNLEALARSIEESFGPKPGPVDAPRVLLHARRFLKNTEWYWLGGPGAQDADADDEIPENLSILGFDVTDILLTTAQDVRTRMRPPPRPSAVPHLVDGDRLALRVLTPARDGNVALTALQAARRLGEDGTTTDPSGPGIGTLLVHVGLETAAGPVARLNLSWSGIAEAPFPYRYLYLPRPELFEALVAELAMQLGTVRTQRLVWGTIPPPSTLPLVCGIDRVSDGTVPPPASLPLSLVGEIDWASDGYYRYYTRPWSRAHFNPRRNRHLTGGEMRAADGAVEAYNAAIVARVERARADGHDWRIADIAGLYRRVAALTGDDPDRKAFLPPALARLEPPISGRFFVSDDLGRVEGGFFSLDGVSPTGVGQGLIAREYLLALADPATAAPVPEVDFDALLQRDDLMQRPPALTRATVSVLALMRRTSEPWWRRALASIGRFCRRGLGFGARFLLPAVLAGAVVLLVLGRDRVLDAGIAAVAGVALVVRLLTISIPARRDRAFDRLADRWGPAAPTAYAISTLVIAVLFATAVTHLLNQLGVATLTRQGQSAEPVGPADVTQLYLWEFLNAIPLAKITDTLNWPQPLKYESPAVGAQILAFQIAIIAPIVVAVTEAWKSRTKRGERYRRRRTEETYRRLFE